MEMELTKEIKNYKEENYGLELVLLLELLWWEILLAF